MSIDVDSVSSHPRNCQGFCTQGQFMITTRCSPIDEMVQWYGSQLQGPSNHNNKVNDTKEIARYDDSDNYKSTCQRVPMI